MQPLNAIGRRLAHFLAQPSGRDTRPTTNNPQLLASTLRKGDVLLVEGSSRFSTAVKYLTQSTWSHAALCISDSHDAMGGDHPEPELLEADVVEGVRTVPLSRYWHQHTRICRPVGLTSDEADAVIDYATARLGHQYDLKNIVDLARYLVQTPPVPTRWRRRMLALGSGDPTRAICSSLIAQAFQSIRYPILPEVVMARTGAAECDDCYDEFLQIRHHSLFAPRDFDISPYFSIIKPSIAAPFDFHQLAWIDQLESGSCEIPATGKAGG